jgi:hypothetical protein
MGLGTWPIKNGYLFKNPADIIAAASPQDALKHQSKSSLKSLSRRLSRIELISGNCFG